MHPGQLPITTAVVAALVADQFPQWSALPIRPVDSDGTDNALFRVGDEFVARFPLLGDDPVRALARLEKVMSAIARSTLRALLADD